mmetsp:Transcript_155132/g.476544  ORF Transcript_155132/g.476544 Transcript_155132/m.476544 type:complete len:140 (+) Transcript_155132:335-754(+)
MAAFPLRSAYRSGWQSWCWRPSSCQASCQYCLDASRETTCSLLSRQLPKGSSADGSWAGQGSWALTFGALFIAAWTTYAFETTVCYTSELKSPKQDTVKAITFSGIVCCVFFWVVPFSFQGVLGPEGELAPDCRWIRHP